MCPSRCPERSEGATPEVLLGAKAIADFLGWSERQVFYRVETDKIPTFRLGKTICAKPETLLRWIELQGAGR